MITKKQYVEYLLSTPFNYTCTNLADHLDGVSHDVVNDFLWQERFRPAQLWELVRGRIDDSREAFLIVDDSVHASRKRYSRFMELVKWQYSGVDHRPVKGIGVVNLVHSNGHAGDFYPIDYRVYAPEQDHKSKNDHFQEMFLQAIEHKRLKARTILFDAWYASSENLKLIHRRHWTFFTTLKSNRLVSLSKEAGYVHLAGLAWSPDQLEHGLIVKLKEVPFKVRLFKVVAPSGDIDWVITNQDSLQDKLNMDSLTVLEFVVSIEETFHIAIADDELLNSTTWMQNISTVAQFINDKVAGNGQVYSG